MMFLPILRFFKSCSFPCFLTSVHTVVLGNNVKHPKTILFPILFHPKWQIFSPDQLYTSLICWGSIHPTPGCFKCLGIYRIPLSIHISSCHQKISISSMAALGSLGPYLRSLSGDLTVTSDITHGFLRRFNQVNQFFRVHPPESMRKNLLNLELRGPSGKTSLLYHGLS